MSKYPKCAYTTIDDRKSVKEGESERERETVWERSDCNIDIKKNHALPTGK